VSSTYSFIESNLRLLTLNDLPFLEKDNNGALSSLKMKGLVFLLNNEI